MIPILLLALSQAETWQATGVKVGEVGPSSAVVWLRRTASSERKADGACPGAPGRVRVRVGTREDLSDAKPADWVAVREEADFTLQLRLEGLEPGTRHHFAAEAEGGAPLRGSFRTAPRPDADEAVLFTVITGQAYKDLDDPAGFRIYDAMAALKPAFLVPTGDTVYYDNDPPLAATKELARLHWQRMYSLPRHVAFHLATPGYWEKDDHDLIWNDCWPGMRLDPRMQFGFEEGKALFLEQVPAPASPYRTVRWGRALQVWLVEGRDFRSSNRAPDGPEKTIWGAAQKAWLRASLLESDADWKVLVSPTPIVGPDRGGKGDNHANAAFRTEGDEMRRWFGEKLPRNFFVACGDRHWQYHSVDPATGVQEFSCGPASDLHAGGSPGEQKEVHRFHRVAGGFLSVSAARASIAFRLHDVRGGVVYEKSFAR
jgi:alkaline phosphatase D